MKKYKVCITYRVTVESEITAQNEDDALEKGYEVSGLCNDPMGGVWSHGCNGMLIVNDEPICDESKVEEVQG